VGKLGREQTTDVVRDSGAKSIFFCSRPNFRAFKMRKKLFLRKAGDKIYLLRRLAMSRKFTFMILSPVLRIPSWPAGPFSEIFEIKIPCKRQQENTALQTVTRVSPTILSYSRHFLAPGKGDSYMKRSGKLVGKLN